MTVHDELYYYGKSVSIEVDDLEWYYVLASREQKNFSIPYEEYKKLSQQEREDYEREKQQIKDKTDRLRRFRYELKDLPIGSIIKLEKRVA